MATQAAPPALVPSIGAAQPGRVLHDSILSTIGNTPVVRLSERFRAAHEVPPDVNLFVKFEAQNPGGSVKDRLALGVLVSPLQQHPSPNPQTLNPKP